MKCSFQSGRSHKLFHSLAHRCSSNSTEVRERKKAKKNPVPLQQPATSKETAEVSKLHKRRSMESQEASKEAGKSEDSRKHKKSSRKTTEDVKKVTDWIISEY